MCTKMWVCIIYGKIPYFWKVKPPQGEPQRNYSGSVPEEGVVIIGDDSSMCFIAPQYFPVKQDVEVEEIDIDDPDPV